MNAKKYKLYDLAVSINKTHQHHLYGFFQPHKPWQTLGTFKVTKFFVRLGKEYHRER